MTPLRLALCCAFGLLLFTPPAAAGGGWWSAVQVDHTTVAAGQRVKVKSFVDFSSAAAAEEARESGRFYVHLLRDFDYSVLEPAMREAAPRNWWTLGGAVAIPVARATVGITDRSAGWARASFTMPVVEPGTYHVMLCDAACTEPLANVFPAARFTVVADPATAQLTRRANRLDRRIGRQATQLAESRADASRTDVMAQNTQDEVEALERRIESLTADAQAPEPVGWWVYAGWLAAATLAGALFLLLRRPAADRGDDRGRGRPLEQQAQVVDARPAAGRNGRGDERDGVRVADWLRAPRRAPRGRPGHSLSREQLVPEHVAVPGPVEDVVADVHQRDVVACPRAPLV